MNALDDPYMLCNPQLKQIYSAYLNADEFKKMDICGRIWSEFVNLSSRRLKMEYDNVTDEMILDEICRVVSNGNPDHNTKTFVLGCISRVTRIDY